MLLTLKLSFLESILSQNRGFLLTEIIPELLDLGALLKKAGPGGRENNHQKILYMCIFWLCFALLPSLMIFVIEKLEVLMVRGRKWKIRGERQLEWSSLLISCLKMLDCYLGSRLGEPNSWQ